MQRRRAYPAQYDRTTWDSRQSDVPAQHMAVNDPYDNTHQADIADLGFDSLQEDLASAAAAASQSPGSGDSPPPSLSSPGGAFVRYSWDSRPLSAWDWYSGSVTDPTVLLTDQTGTFTIPPGMIGVVRTITFTPGALVGPVIDVTGIPLNNYYITILKNGLPVQGFTLIDVSPGWPSGGEIECFILCQPGDVITGSAFFGGVQVDSHTTLIQPVGFRFWGTVIPNDGRNIGEQVGNAQCEPVCIDAASIAQLKPAPLVLPPTSPGGAPLIVTGQPVLKPNCPLPPAVSVNDYLACVLAH